VIALPSQASDETIGILLAASAARWSQETAFSHVTRAGDPVMTSYADFWFRCQQYAQLLSEHGIAS